MLKTRIIPVALYRGHEVVKGTQFNSWRSIGHVRQAVRIFNARDVDGLVLLDVTATREGRDPDFTLFETLASECFFPLYIGGGIRNLGHCREALKNGADAVVLNTAVLDSPDLITDLAVKFGSQSICISIDYKDGKVFSHSGTVERETTPLEWAIRVKDLGAGEIILNSIDRDGMMNGYDLDLIAQVSQAVSIPVIACGGAGNAKHLADAIDSGASAVAAGAIWAFSDLTPREAAVELGNYGIKARMTQ